MHDAVMAEFGDSHIDAPVGIVTLPEDVMHAGSGSDMLETGEDDMALGANQSQPQAVASETTIEA